MKAIIHCINLPRAIERKENILNSWQGYEIRFFSAVDCRSIVNTFDLYDGEVACAISHSLLLESFLQTDEEWIAVMEDDVKCLRSAQEFSLFTDLITYEFPHAEAFILHKSPYKQRMQASKVGRYGVLLSKATWGNYLIMYNRSGAKRMISLLQSMKAAADHYWDEFAIRNRLVFSNISFGEHLGVDTYIGPRGIKILEVRKYLK
jgi:GR25 family glycosyltransferase involved in LPS biosynthesis